MFMAFATHPNPGADDSSPGLSIRHRPERWAAAAFLNSLPMSTLISTFNAPLLKASWRSWINNNGQRVGPYWLQWVWTLLFAAVLAVPFTALGFAAFAGGEGDWRNLSGWAFWYGKNFIVCFTVAAVIHLLFDLLLSVMGLGKRVALWPMWQRSVFFAGVPMLGVVIGWPLGVYFAGEHIWNSVTREWGPNAILGSVGISLITSLVMHQYFSTKAQQYAAEKRATEAQLRLLQGQIEPHFLFNTLANVLTLIDVDAPQAKRMLESFIDYLRASLGNLRQDHSTLEHELGMARAYLELMHMRMGNRLAFEVQAPAASLPQVSLPPLLLQPLVENAIHHGLESSVNGGRVDVTVRQEGHALVLIVDDSGVGLQAASAAKRPSARARTGHNGMAIDNLRQRLAARYGEAASLTLQDRAPHGVRATVRVPISSSDTP
jgi:hypothetical protein